MVPQVGQCIIYASEFSQKLVCAYVIDVRGKYISLQLGGDSAITVTYDSNRFQQVPNRLILKAKAVLPKNDQISGQTGSQLIGNADAGVRGTAASDTATNDTATSEAATGNAATTELRDDAAHTVDSTTVSIGGVVSAFIVSGLTCIATSGYCLPIPHSEKVLPFLVSHCETGSIPLGFANAGITSGLAALGGGSLAEEYGMVRVLTVLCSWACLPVIAIVVAVWGITHLIREEIIYNRCKTFVKTWKIQGYTV